VERFSVPQIVQTEGHFSGGSVTVRALPLEVLGPDNMHTWPLRRLEGLVSPQELEEHVGRELSKVRAAAAAAAGAASLHCLMHPLLS
jgi:hypothetical protein